MVLQEGQIILQMALSKRGSAKADFSDSDFEPVVGRGFMVLQEGQIILQVALSKRGSAKVDFGGSDFEPVVGRTMRGAEDALLSP